jgi:subtilisin family serine protease
MKYFNEDFYQHDDNSHGAHITSTMSPEILLEFEQQIEAEELDADEALCLLRGEHSIG